MKLLLDQNLSWRLVKALQGSFAEIAHVRDFALDRAADADDWEYARREGFVILSKDSDFEQRSLLHGHPPKCIWLRVGNLFHEGDRGFVASPCVGHPQLC